MGDSRILKIDALTPWDAVLEFAKQIQLPQTGWVVVEGDHIVTYKISGGAPVSELPPLPTISPVPSNSSPATSSAPSDGFTYPALRVISGLFRIIAVLAAISSVIAGFVFADECYRSSEKTMSILAGFVGAFFSWVVFWGIAEIIHVIIDIEANTRRTAQNTAK